MPMEYRRRRAEARVSLATGNLKYRILELLITGYIDRIDRKNARDS